MKNILTSNLMSIAFAIFLFFSFTPKPANEIKEYKVVQVYLLYPSEASSHIERVVSPYLKDGWQPLGGLCEAGEGYYFQVMVKY